MIAQISFMTNVNMNLLSRLYHIIRSTLPTQEGPGVIFDENDDFEARPGGGARQRSTNDRQTEFQDAELARYYANLEVPYGSDLETVRSAWKRLVRKYHPDLHSNDPKKRQVANELTQGLNRAYKELETKLRNQTASKTKEER